MNTLVSHQVRGGRARRRLLAVVIAQVLAGHGAHAATIAVDDLGGGSGGSGCSLRDAVTAANLDQVVAGCPAGAGFDRIVIPAGATVVLDRIDNADNCLPVIRSNLSIAGSGSSIQASSSGPACRLFDVEGGASIPSFLLEGLTLSGGRVAGDGGAIRGRDVSVTLQDVTVTGNRAGNGGGLDLGGATLVMQDSVISGNTATGVGGGLMTRNPAFVYAYGGAISDNTATAGGGAYLHRSEAPRRPALQPGGLAGALVRGGVREALRGAGGYGSFFYGVIFNANEAGLSTPRANGEPVGSRYASGGGLHVAEGVGLLSDCTVSGNRAADFGGGVAATQGAVATIDSRILGNRAAGFGGGVGLSYGYQINVRTTLEANQAASGGAIGAIDSFQVLYKTTLSGNTASGAAAPLRGVASNGQGGGLYGVGSYLIMTTSTLSGNLAAVDGAALSWTKYGALPRRGGWVESIRRGPAKYAVDLRQSTLAFNRLSTSGGAAVRLGQGDEAALLNTIISNPVTLQCITSDGMPPTVVTSLVRDGSCGADLLGEPRLTPLALNGGATATHNLGAGSPAALAGDPAVCATSPPTDQNGSPVPDDGISACSLGATQGTVGAAGSVAVPSSGLWGRLALALGLALTAILPLRRARGRSSEVK